MVWSANKSLSGLTLPKTVLGRRSGGLARRSLALWWALWPAFLILSCSQPPNALAVRGVQDLRGKDLSQTIVPLDGTWHFVPGQLADPRSIESTSGTLKGAGEIKVPAVWNHQKVLGRELPARGVGTYHLRVLLPDNSPRWLGLHLREIGVAYRVYANGELVHASGQPDPDPSRARPDYRTGVVRVQANGPLLDLVFHVSNHRNKWGGIWHSIGFGAEPIVQRGRDQKLLAELTMFGMLLALGIYHLTLFGFRPRDRSPFYFGIFCVAVAFRTVLTGERALIGQLDDGYDWQWAYRWEYLSFYLSVPAWIAYLASLYPKLSSRRAIAGLLIACVPFVGMVLVSPVAFYADYLWAFQLLTIVAGLYTTWVSVRAVRAREIGALIFLVGWLVLFVAVAFDIVAAQGLIPTANLVPFFFVVFVLAQSTIIAQRFSSAFATAEQLTLEMDRRVRERTMELASAKDEAERSNRAKSEFLSVVSHELRTPMHGILGAADLLTESKITDQQHGYIRLLKRSGTRMMKLIAEILDMARIEAGRVELESNEMSLRELLEQSLVALGVRARAKDIQLSVDVAGDVPDELIGDASRFEQVLVNLVGNALKFAEGGKVAVKATLVSRTERSVLLLFSVSDTGPGIAEELKGQLFTPFTQGDSSSTRRHGGTGLGLAISRGLVELMGGTIDFRDAPQGGAEFFFTVRFGLKLAPTIQSSSPRQHASSKTDWTKLQGLRLLVAEDSEDNVQLMMHYLKGSGIDVTIVGNGQRALEEHERERFDAVLLDIQMPVLDGLSAARAMRARETELGLPRIPILALSASAMAHDIERSLDAGCDAHLAKPVSKASLLAALSARVSNSK